MSIVDNLEKAFDKTVGKKLDKAWETHVSAFGCILENAFVDNYAARTHLTNALNKISQHDAERGIVILENDVIKYCVTDEDKFVYLFFMGLAYDFLGNRSVSVQFWRNAEQFNDNYYLLHLKIAKAAHADAVFDMASDYYEKAISCLLKNNENVKGGYERTLASAYSNLCSCLTMMQKFDDAQRALECSENILSVFPEREATKAILCAASGNEKGLSESLTFLQMNTPGVYYNATKKMTDEILAGRHAQFSAISCDENLLKHFWERIVEKEEKIVYVFKNGDYEQVEKVLNAIGEELTSNFSFMNKPVEVGVEVKNEKWEVSFADSYSVGLRCGLEQLIDLCPEGLKENWIFTIVH